MIYSEMVPPDPATAVTAGFMYTKQFQSRKSFAYLKSWSSSFFSFAGYQSNFQFLFYFTSYCKFQKLQEIKTSNKHTFFASLFINMSSWVLSDGVHAHAHATEMWGCSRMKYFPLPLHVTSITRQLCCYMASVNRLLNSVVVLHFTLIFVTFCSLFHRAHCFYRWFLLYHVHGVMSGSSYIFTFLCVHVTL